jgi:hypothetical protein
VVVPENVGEAMSLLRDAARAGSLRAKIYLANVYELGIGRSAEPEKADVWYRSVARERGIETAEDDPECARALAELGCIRHVRTLIGDHSLPQRERLALLARAKPLGYALFQRNKKREQAERQAVEAEVNASLAAAEAARPATPAQTKKAEVQPKEKQKKRDPWRPPAPERVMALFLALVFLATGFGLGMMLGMLAKSRLTAGDSVPLFGERVELIRPALFALSVLPTWLLYPLHNVLITLVCGAALTAGGWAYWSIEHGRWFADRVLQAEVFGITGVLVSLVLLTLLGGTRRRRAL